MVIRLALDPEFTQPLKYLRLHACGTVCSF